MIAEADQGRRRRRRPARCAATSACARCSASSPSCRRWSCRAPATARTRWPRSASAPTATARSASIPAGSQTMLAIDPDGVEALFNPTQYSSSPFLTIKSAGRQVEAGHLYDHRRRPGRPPAAASGKIDGVADDRRRAPTSSRPPGSAALGLILGVERRRRERHDHRRSGPRRRAAGDPRRAARPRRRLRRDAQERLDEGGRPHRRRPRQARDALGQILQPAADHLHRDGPPGVGVQGDPVLSRSADQDLDRRQRTDRPCRSGQRGVMYVSRGKFRRRRPPATRASTSPAGSRARLRTSSSRSCTRSC